MTLCRKIPILRQRKQQQEAGPGSFCIYKVGSCPKILAKKHINIVQSGFIMALSYYYFTI